MAAYRHPYNGNPSMPPSGYPQQQPQGYVPYGSPPPQLPPVHMSPLQYGYGSPGSPQPGMTGPGPMNMSGHMAMSMQNGTYSGQGQYISPPPPPSAPVAPPAQSKGTLKPGQEVTVGQQVVVVDRYLSEGGYAHVYLTHSRQPIGPNRLTSHCLKRIAFQAGQAPEMMKDVEREIEVMKVLSGAGGGMGMSEQQVHDAGGQGCRWIVEYLDSSVNRTKNGGWEVFILMEFCAGGGIIDLLNKRLRDRLKEEEILGIFVDICEAVAFMHALPRPLLHRDLKIENILSHPKPTSNSSSFPAPVSASTSHLVFKLCDFGSTTFPAAHAPRSKKESDELAYDLNRHTTLQYRSPEMVEPMLGLAVGLPADVWALGVLLYKLCYYTTPFEEHGPLAIVNAKYTFPSFPVYSPKLQHLIAAMLVEHPMRRPTVFEVLARVHKMRGTAPSTDYSKRSVRREVEPTEPSRSGQTDNLLDFTSSASQAQSAAALQAQVAASIQPQRRGRPTRETRPSSGAVPQIQPDSDSAEKAPAPTGSDRPKLQVTGDNAANKLPVATKTNVTGNAGPAINIDRPSDGFGDAFGLTKSSFKPSSSPSNVDSASRVKGFDDSFGGGGFGSSFAPSTLPAKTSPTSTGAGLKPTTASRELEDAFIPKPKPQTNLSRSSTLSKPSVRPAASMRRSPSSNPDGEASFEERFPSIEALTSGESSRPRVYGIAQGERSSSTRIERPAMNTYPSLTHASVTGGNDTENQPSRAVPPAVDGRPLPRSTQVTGTAFKESTTALSQGLEQGKQLGASDTSSNRSESVPAREDAKQLTRNGMGRKESAGSGYSSTLASQSAPPGRLQSRQSWQAPARAPSSEQQPSVSASKSTSPSKAPVKDLLTGDDSSAFEPKMKPQIKDLLTGEDSMDGPRFSPLIPSLSTIGQGNRSAYRASMPPPKMAKPAGLANLSIASSSSPVVEPKPVSSMMTDQWSPLERARADMAAKPPTVQAANAKSPILPDVPLARELPSSSMAVPSSTTSAPQDKIPSPASATSESHAPPIAKKPPTARRSSINDVLSQFETMSTSPEEPKPPAGAHIPTRSETTPVPMSRPPVAPKPDQHRAPRSSSISADGASASEPPAAAPKPVNSSNSAFRRTTLNATTEPSAETREPSIERSGSPDKKQSVNSLIAKWNQANPPVNGVVPQKIQGRLNIGTGRRL